ncbi:hypothetical protein MM213_15350 [Belliella sp. R4-6]|uniref:Outer membrane protein beta-barrel domain-containing protein n=1 Tax=Belliella alkalica TaxID=1730871 RepID=A0ABS9VEK4_9BACT|nr:hypothetical protein [Belliella alkalica]MCH7414875.1 hypothetical protein [Belliella alkalica]
MRHILFTLAFFVLWSSSLAQVEKGLWFISGQVNLDLNNTERSDIIYNSGSNYESSQFTHAIDFSPRMGYMLSNHWLIGADINLGKLKYSSDQFHIGSSPSNIKQWIDSYGFGLFTRRFFDMDENLQIFAEGRIGYYWLEERSGVNSSQIQTNRTLENYGGHLSVGLHYWMLPNLSLEINTRFLSVSNQEIDFPEIDSRPIPIKEINRGLRFSFGQSIGIGFNFIF